MRIAVMGTGAVGGYFGAKLAAAGHDVGFIARGKHLAALQRSGLRIESTDGGLTIRNAQFIGRPGQTGVVDLVLFCVKSYDSAPAAAELAPLMKPTTVILSLQNGVDNIEKIARLWGSERTLAGVVYIGAQVTSPGVVAHYAEGRIVLGSIGGQPAATARAIEQALSRSGIPCKLSNDIERGLWTKLLWNAPFCAIACLTRSTVRQIVESESLTHLTLDCMNEVQAAAQTRGIELRKDLFEQTLTFSRRLGDYKPSMLQDLESRKPLEYDAFNGIIVRLLQAAGKDAPTNRVFYETLKYLDHKIREEGSR